MSVLAAVGEGLVELGLEQGTPEVALGFGGDVANVCVMAAHCGVPARLGGRVGTDPLGDRLLEFWRQAGVEIEAVRRDRSAPTGLYLNEARKAGHRFTYWRTGSAGSRLAPGDLGDSFFRGIGILVVSGVTLAISSSAAAAAEEAVERSRAGGARIACVINYRPNLAGNEAKLDRLARASDIVVGSRDDARAVFGTGDPRQVAGLLNSPTHELVLTDGSNPSTLVSDEGIIRQPVPPTEVRNAAGAGDALAGAYLASRMLERSPGPSLALGVAAASLSVRQPGCAASYPAGDDARAFAAALPSQRSKLATSEQT